jgi:hypothetical protein
MKKIKITKEQFDILKKAGLLESSPIKGGIDRVQKSFNQGFAGKDIKQVDEDENFNIKKPNTDLSSSSQKPLGKKHEIGENEDKEAKTKKGGTDKVSKEIKDLLKHLYGYTPEFNSDYWTGEKEKSIDEIIEHLTSKGVIVKKGRNYIVPKTLGSNEEAKAALDECMREFVGEPMEEIDEDSGDGAYPLDSDNSAAPFNQEDPEPIHNRTDFKILVYNDDLAILKDKYTNEFFMLDFSDNQVKYEGIEMSEDDVNDFLNNNEPNLSKILIPLDENLINELGEMYNLNSYFQNKLEQIKAEMAGEFNDLNQAGLDEMTSAAGGSSGAFTGPLGPAPIRKEIPTVNETLSVAGAGKFQYDAPGIANVGRNGEYKKGGKKPKAFKTPQWAGGAMVEQPECSKLNNNKEAQNGGCNSGASSLKTKKLSGSVNAPSLAENEIIQEVAKRTGKTPEEVIQIITNKK